jgi:hypothetical protein
LGRLEIIADDLYALLEASRAHFFLSRVEKRYLLAVKMFDVLFDSGENAAGAWHNYNLRSLKINYKGGFYRLPDGYAAGALLAHCPVRGSGGKGGRSSQSTFHPFRIAQWAPGPRHLLALRLHFSRLGRR